MQVAQNNLETLRSGAAGALAQAKADQAAKDALDAERQRIVATTPLGRIGDPGDIAQAVHFLACAPYVTGQTLAVDGGRSIFI